MKCTYLQFKSLLLRSSVGAGFGWASPMSSWADFSTQDGSGGGGAVRLPFLLSCHPTRSGVAAPFRYTQYLFVQLSEVGGPRFSLWFFFFFFFFWAWRRQTGSQHVIDSQFTWSSVNSFHNKQVIYFSMNDLYDVKYLEAKYTCL